MEGIEAVIDGIVVLSTRLVAVSSTTGAL